MGTLSTSGDVSHRRDLPGLIQQVAALPNGELILNKIEPGAVLPRHSHPHLQFGFALIGRFDLLAGEPLSRHGVGSERAYLLRGRTPHTATQEGKSPVFSIDLKLLIPRESLPDVNFFEPVIERLRWGKRYSYYLPWFDCEYIKLDPRQEARIDFRDGDQYVISLNGDAQGLGTIHKLHSPFGARSEDSGSHLVHVTLLENNMYTDRKPVG
jgi:hypothetical protein